MRETPTSALILRLAMRKLPSPSAAYAAETVRIADEIDRRIPPPRFRMGAWVYGCDCDACTKGEF